MDLLGLKTTVIITTDFLLLLPFGSHVAVYSVSRLNRKQILPDRPAYTVL